MLFFFFPTFPHPFFLVSASSRFVPFPSSYKEQRAEERERNEKLFSVERTYVQGGLRAAQRGNCNRNKAAIKFRLERMKSNRTAAGFAARIGGREAGALRPTVWSVRSAPRPFRVRALARFQLVTGHAGFLFFFSLVTATRLHSSRAWNQRSLTRTRRHSEEMKRRGRRNERDCVVRVVASSPQAATEELRVFALFRGFSS